MSKFAIGRRILLATIAVALGVTGITIGLLPDSSRSPSPSRPEAPHSAAALTFQRLDRPARTVARNNVGDVVATMTDGARTVALLGPQRTFRDPGFTTATITTTAWVRLMPHEWSAGAEREPWFSSWIDHALVDESPDVFGVATQYFHGQPTTTDAAGVAYRGDAGFGPAIPGAVVREENSDFYDYLGVPWTFLDGRRETPAADHYRDVDCSGFLRLVLGYRLGYPLRDTDTAGPGLPRRAWAIAALGPGQTVVPDRGGAATDYSALQPGDLVFFNLDAEPQIDHSAIYVGLDSTGHHRFLSSRGRADGPTMGDLGGNSLLDDGSRYARGFRTARRV
jgi:cell wall-associated NlpC family hydrolase